MIRSIFWLLAASLAVGCSKPEEAPAPAASSVTVAATPPAVSVSAAPVASAAPATTDGGAECDGHRKPCPLQAWMRENMQAPLTKGDAAALAAALDKSAAMAPPGYTNWASISKDGANAARSGDLAAAKASCRGCHDQYKQKYKDEMRGRAI